MKSIPLFASALALSATLFASADEGWKPLFDGQTLEGWKVVNGTAPFSVEDGAIVGVTVHDSPNTFLATERQFGDFVLEFEFKVDDGMNSGVQFRSHSKPEFQNGRVHGYQYEIETSSRGWTGGIYDEARRGWIYPVEFNPSAKPLYRSGQWNQARIVCAGSDLRTYLNGQLVSHVVDDLSPAGFIALQVHSIGENSPAGDKVRWRQLRLKELDSHAAAQLAAEPNDSTYIRNLLLNRLSPVEDRAGWELLFDGTQTRGLSPADDSEAFRARWSIENGELIVTRREGDSPHADLVTEQMFAAFELDIEFKPSSGANSGIKYFVEQYTHSETGKSERLGLEYQILDDERHPDAKQGVLGNRTSASLYDLIPRDRAVIGREVPHHIDDWNHARIVARNDGTVEHWLNGYKVLAYQRGSNTYKVLVAHSKYAPYQNFGLAERGAILIQDHSDLVAFRNLRIRDLP